MSSSSNIYDAVKQGNYERVLFFLNGTLLHEALLRLSVACLCHRRLSSNSVIDMHAGMVVDCISILGHHLKDFRDQTIIRAPCDVNAPSSYYSNTCLHYAIYCGQNAVANLLLDRGADPNAIAPAGYGAYYTCLSLASSSWWRPPRARSQDRLDIILKMVRMGGCLAYRAGPAGTGRSVLEVLNEGRWCNHSPSGVAVDVMAGALEEACASRDHAATASAARADAAWQERVASCSIYDASKGGHLDRLRALLDSGHDVNAPSSYYSNTCLHYAINCGQNAVANLLLDRGANPNAIAPAGYGAYYTCLSLASSSPRSQDRLDVILKMVRMGGCLAYRAGPAGTGRSVLEVLNEGRWSPSGVAVDVMAGALGEAVSARKDAHADAAAAVVSAQAARASRATADTATQAQKDREALAVKAKRAKRGDLEC